MYYYVEPEVAGGLGEGTVMDTSEHPPVIQSLTYEFDGWLGDHLLESFPCFIVTETVEDAIKELGLTGCSFDAVDIKKSEAFEDSYPDRALPHFSWLKIHGIAGMTDFGLTDDYRLVVSNAVIDLLKKFGLQHAEIYDYSQKNEQY
ncbi:hypothetical protein [Pseudomonas alloputida]|uniref:hypothetical protein n=1 Tax=Pseudomonas TaxID=286 RepID=UPI003EEE6124